ncbi:MAG: prepilin-type N-terminal cleavage/methylation domain-containing protein [Verrucomicrobiia bacterium]|jgi:uncharacterized protein (TIGR02598 family)
MRTYCIRTTRSRQSATLHGFSLIEVVIALAVISVGLIAIVGLIPQGIQSARDAGDNTLAATIVQDTLNAIRQQALTTWPPFSTQLSYYYDATGTTQLNTTVSTADTYYEVHLPPPQSSANGNLLTVTAIVWWPVKTGVTAPLNTNTYVTLIANYQH